MAAKESSMNRIKSNLIVSATCLTLITSSFAGLTHRYSFNDGTAKDVVGNVDGKLVGEGATVADGKLVLKNDPAVTDPTRISHAAFDKPILPTKGSATIVFWMQAKDVAAYARVLDIGETVGGDGNAFFYFTPRTIDENSRAAISSADVGQRIPVDNPRLDDDKPHMVAVVINGEMKKMQVFIDGKPGIEPQDLGDNTLERINPVNNFLGKSSFHVDPGLTATIDELRIYDHAMTASEVAAAHAAGPNTIPATQPAR
jgi:hypothetical protein